MRLIVDTHIFLWSVQDQAQLPTAHASALAAPEVELWLSAVSILEIRQKNDAGKLALKDALEALVADFELRCQGVLAITRAHALVRLADPPATKDPFDRLLLAQCESEGMKLLTVDKKLRSHRLAAPL